jgi:hypothetical protein
MGANCTRGKIMGSTANNIVRSDKSQINALRWDPAARIWIQSGKIMGFVATTIIVVTTGPIMLPP